MSERLNIAVVGGGVAGIVSAHLLDQRHDVTLYEADDRLGGHTNTVTISEGPDAGTGVDTGFIVLNDRTYPGLHRFLERLGVGVRYSDMSFGFYSEVTGCCYAGTGIGGLFADSNNLLRPSYYRFLLGIRNFCNAALQALEDGSLTNLSLGEFVRKISLSREVIENYVLPIGAAIWSAPSAHMLEFPAATYIQFFKNHGLLAFSERPRWQTVVGGSSSYVAAFKEAFKGSILTGSPVKSIERTETEVIIRAGDGPERRFDHVIIAIHADQVLSALESPSENERRLFGEWRYQKNQTQLHWDTSLLPPNRRAWASWNYREEGESGQVPTLSVTYDMNRLQGLQTERHYCVTLNTEHKIDPGKVVAEFSYTHPVFSKEAVSTQAQLSELNGLGRVWFCGSYFGYGFHEDALQSAVALGHHFGAAL